MSESEAGRISCNHIPQNFLQAVRSIYGHLVVARYDATTYVPLSDHLGLDDLLKLAVVPEPNRMTPLCPLLIPVTWEPDLRASRSFSEHTLRTHQ
jgi:hypothetical protein